MKFPRYEVWIQKKGCSLTYWLAKVINKEYLTEKEYNNLKTEYKNKYKGLEVNIYKNFCHNY